MEIQNQCISFGSNGKRCTSLASTGCRFCKDHYDGSIKLYRNYKRICGYALNLKLDRGHDNNQSKIEYLLKCYSWLNRAFDARLKHRRLAIVPDCYDDGHDFQFQKIKELMETCERSLTELFNSTLAVEEKDITITDEDQKEIQEVLENEDKVFSTRKRKNLKELVIKIKKFRDNSEEEANELVQKYISENKPISERWNHLINLVISYITQFIKPDVIDQEKDYLGIYRSVYETINFLTVMGYFEPAFKPCLCSCGDYSVYILELSLPKFFQNRRASYCFNEKREQDIRWFYERLIRNKNVVQTIVEDLVNIYKMFGPRTFNMDMQLIWNSELRLYNLAAMVVRKKLSKTLCDIRLTRKAFSQKYGDIPIDED